MKIAKDWKDYEIIATSNGEKLERWGNVFLKRPDPQIVWKTNEEFDKFDKLHACYLRESTGGGSWKFLKKFPESWQISWKNLKFVIKPMGFKHTGLFPEQAVNWEIMMQKISEAKREIKVLNLFAYTGAATLACASVGASVCHIDAAKGMVERAKENAKVSGLSGSKIRFIVDDCRKFVEREIKRGKKYDAIIMDPPSYGRGANGEVWKLEDNLFDFVSLCAGVLSEKPLFVLLNSYTTGLAPTVLQNVLKLCLKDFSGEVESYEVCLPTGDGIFLPCGASGLWSAKK